MTTPPSSRSPGPPPDPGGPEPLAATVAGLAREVEALRRTHDDLRRETARVDELAGVVKQLVDTVDAAKPPATSSQVAASWLDIDHEAPTRWAAEDMLSLLVPWVGGVYLRYSDTKLSDCWLWHPDVVEELLWLHYAWLSAYDPEAPPSAVGDWHDRQRPGVTARIKTYAGMCSLEAHQPGQDRALPAPTAPTADAVPAIAAWWGQQREQPGPEPTAEQLDAARQRFNTRGRR